MIHQILAHTPIWVFVILFLLVRRGIAAMQPRAMRPIAIIVMPLIFMTIGAARLFDGHHTAMAVLVWAAALLVLVPLGIATGPHRLVLDRANDTVLMPGSIMPLLRYLVIFLIQYASAVAGHMAPHGASPLALIGTAASGGTAGYFLGWLIIFARQYLRAKRAA